MLCFRIRPVSPSMSTIWFDQARAMLPFGRMLRLAFPIQWPEAFRLSRYVRQPSFPVVASALAMKGPTIFGSSSVGYSPPMM